MSLTRHSNASEFLFTFWMYVEKYLLRLQGYEFTYHIQNLEWFFICPILTTISLILILYFVQFAQNIVFFR